MPYQQGGDVVFVPPEYYGLAGLGQGLGQGAQAIGQAMFQNKEIKKRDEQQKLDNLMQQARLAYQIGGTQGYEDFLKNHPDFNTNSQNIQLTPTVAEQQASAIQALGPGEQQQAALGIPTQTDMRYKNALLVGQNMKLVQDAQAAFGTEGAMKIKQALVSGSADAANEAIANGTLVPTMGDVQAKAAARLVGDPKLLNWFQNQQLFGDVRGPSAMAQSMNLGDQAKRAQIGLTNAETQSTLAEVPLKQAQAENVKSDTVLNQARTVAAKAKGDPVVKAAAEAYMAQYAKVGGNPQTAIKFFEAPDQLTSDEKKEILAANTKIAAMNMKSEPDGLKKLIALKKAGLPTPVGKEEIAKMLARSLSTKDEQWEAVEDKGIFSSSWDVKPVVGQQTKATQQSDPVEEMRKRIQSQGADKIKAAIDGMNDDNPNKKLLQQYYQQATGGSNE